MRGLCWQTIKQSVLKKSIDHSIMKIKLSHVPDIDVVNAGRLLVAENV